MEDSAQSETSAELRTSVLECINTLLNSLLSLTTAPGLDQISDEFVYKINMMYSDLESCDYIGIKK